MDVCETGNMWPNAGILMIDAEWKDLSRLTANRTVHKSKHHRNQTAAVDSVHPCDALNF